MNKLSQNQLEQLEVFDFVYSVLDILKDKQIEIWRSRMTNTSKRQTVNSQCNTKTLQNVR